MTDAHDAPLVRVALLARDYRNEHPRLCLTVGGGSSRQAWLHGFPAVVPEDQGSEVRLPPSTPVGGGLWEPREVPT
jgi:hypothetical protein